MCSCRFLFQTPEGWLPGSHYLTDAKERLESARSFLARSGWQIRRCLVLWCQGESDGDAATPPALYKQRFTQMFHALQEQGVEDCLLIRIGCYNGEAPAVCYGPIRQAQEELCRELSHVHLVSTAFAGMKARGLMQDAFHYYQQAYNKVGAEAAQNAVHALGLLAARPK